ncbi:type II secretion system F family protein [Chloroflexota bacterium]
MSYKYVAYTGDKRIVKGTVNVGAEGQAEEALKKVGYRVISLKQVKPGLNLEQLLPTFFGVKPRDVIAFSRQLSTLIESGISLAIALRLLEEQVSSSAFRSVIAGLSKELQGGSSFSQALTKHPQVFPDTYRQIVGAGEHAGNLEVALRQAVSYMERGTAATQKVKRAMMYPAMVLLLAIGVVIIMMTFALPPLLGLFDALEAELPLTTKFLIALTGFLSTQKFYLLGAVLILTVLSLWYFRRPAGRFMLDKILLRMPIISSMIIQSNMALFSRTMSVLLNVGLPLPQIMDIVCKTINNRIISQALRDVQGELIRGNGLSQPMANIKLFPRLLTQMVMVGEQTGTLDSNLTTLANFYEEEVNQRINALTSMLEPAMTVGVALVVAFIALSLIMPMYSIMGSI